MNKSQMKLAREVKEEDEDYFKGLEKYPVNTLKEIYENDEGG